MPFQKLSPKHPIRIGTLTSSNSAMRAALFLFIFSSNWQRKWEVALMKSDSLSGDIYLNKKWFSNIISNPFYIAFLKLTSSLKSVILSNTENFIQMNSTGWKSLLGHAIWGLYHPSFSDAINMSTVCQGMS